VRPWYRDVPAWALAAAASVMFVLGMAGGIVSRVLLPAPAARVQAAAPLATPTISVSPTNADMAAMERRILGVVQTQLDQQIKPLAAHLQTTARHDREAMLQEVRRLVSTSEERQRQALNASMLNWLRDSQQTFVSNRDFNTFRREELGPSVRSALVAYQRNQQ
jgi:hypothetical protein